LSKIETLIIDEADEMLAMGFIEQVEEILNELPSARTTALFSATMPKAVKELADSFLYSPKLIEIAPSQQAKPRVRQQFIRVDEEDKMKAFKDLFIVDNPESSIIFCNTKIMVERLTKEI